MGTMNQRCLHWNEYAKIYSGYCLTILPLFYRESLLKSASWDNVDLIYNGLSDAYETLYPVLDNANNEGGMRLLKQSQVGNLTVSPFFICMFTNFSQIMSQFAYAI
jgi:hypothetical protein